jgi:hypothetical protein
MTAQHVTAEPAPHRQAGQNAQMRILVIIPALNEQASIGRVIAAIRDALPDIDIIVINDGSTDNTERVALAAGAMVASLPFNLGIGSAMQTGFIYARDHGYDVAFQVDGDGQHDAQELFQLLDRLQTTDADVVIGSRYIEDRGYITPRLRRTGIVVLSWLISLIVGQHITDPTSGFRASNRRAILFCATEYPFDYPEPEAIVLFRRAGLRVNEIAVTMNPRYGGQSSITPVRSGYYMIKVIMAIMIGLLRGRPQSTGGK